MAQTLVVPAIAVVGSIALGFWFESLGFSEAAWLFVWVLCAVIIALHSVGNLRLHNLGKKHPMTSLFVTFLIGGTLFALGWRAFVQREVPSVKLDESQPSGRGDDLYVEVAYQLDLMGLPIVIPPDGVMWLVHIREGRKVDLVQHSNRGAKDPFQWPAPLVTPPDSVGIVQFSNQGDLDVFGVDYRFSLAIGAQKDPDGVTNQPVRLPLFDLRPGIIQQFRIVNQSKTTTLIQLSDSAVVRVKGEEDRRQIGVRVRSLTFFDKIPMLGPSMHEWEGDKILYPDKWPNAQE
jgi:hypothetical protein